MLLSASALKAAGHIRQLGIEQGLSNNYVMGIEQDKTGALWFATEDGLNRFDGIRFATFFKSLKAGERGLTGNELNCLLDDPRDSILWIGTQRYGLNAYHYNKDRFEYFRHDDDDPQSLSTDDVTCLIAGPDDCLWVGTYWQGIDCFDKRTRRFTHYNTHTVQGLPGNAVWSLAADSEGHLYVAHAREGFSVINVKTRTATAYTHDPADPQSLPNNVVHKVYRDPAGHIWVGTDSGLALFDAKTGHFTPIGLTEGRSVRPVYDIRIFGEDQLWVGFELDGVAVLDLSQHLFHPADEVLLQFIEHDPDLGNTPPTIRCLFEDRYKNKWIGVWGDGIHFISHEEPLFDTYAYSPLPSNTHSLNNKVASCVAIDREGQWWVGTDGGGLNVFRQGRRTAVYQLGGQGPSDNSLQTAYCDAEGTLWFGSFMGGVDVYTPTTRRFRHVALPGKQASDVRAFCERGDTLWIGTSDGVFRLSKSTLALSGPYQLGNNLVRTLQCDAKGRLWVGFYGAGLGVYDASLGQLQLFDTYAGFPSNTVNTLYIDKEGRLWAGTAEGLVCFPHPTQGMDYTLYAQEKGLHNTHIHAIQQDREGHLWVSTNQGLCCYLDERRGFLHFDGHDGVPMGSFRDGSSAIDAEGRLYFGSINGLCTFLPEKVLLTQPYPKAQITKMRLFVPIHDEGKQEEVFQLTGRTHLRLSYQQNSFTVTFNIPDYALTDRVEYAYMLKGREDAWYVTTDPNSVTFRSLPPGHYTLCVKARIRNQEWPADYTSLDIRITPPVWLSAWAIGLYALLLLSLVGYFLWAYRRRVHMRSLYLIEKRRREQEQSLTDERLRFYTNITHELRTPLTLILGPLEDMQRSVTLVAADRQKISLIHQSAIRLLNLINQILEFRKTETQNRRLCVRQGVMAQLMEEVALKYSGLNRNEALHFEVDIDKELESHTEYFDREVITIVLDNLLSNAVKYTARGTITLGLHRVIREQIAYIQLSVKDTGHGIAPEALPHLFDRYYQAGGQHQASGTGIGLALVRNLVTLHEGDISVQSTPGEGTTFTVSLLEGNTYPHVLHAEEAPSVPQEEEESETAADAIDTQKRILLIVEDDADIADYVADSFKQEFTVHKAVNGIEGFEKALSCMPDLIVSDVMMPMMDGNELCRHLKADVRTSHIPVILLTAKDALADKEQGYEAGADSYLTKPFSATLLHSRIVNLLEGRRKLAQHIQQDTLHTEKQTQLTDSMSKLDREFIDKINTLIEERLQADKIDISYLAGHLCMSTSTLYRKMKALTGLSTNEYIRKIKMQHAERLMLEGKYTISEVAFRVGINSPVYFRQCFKEEFGVSPSDYMKRLAENT
jgi:signal transduction histidine kinase/ligand-binding sensor domain-containing protein/DNA-binding response OmpR family regulator